MGFLKRAARKIGGAAKKATRIQGQILTQGGKGMIYGGKALGAAAPALAMASIVQPELAPLAGAAAAGSAILTTGGRASRAGGRAHKALAKGKGKKASRLGGKSARNAVDVMSTINNY